jgi:hypothetical protein
MSVINSRLDRKIQARINHVASDIMSDEKDALYAKDMANLAQEYVSRSAKDACLVLGYNIFLVESFQEY